MADRGGGCAGGSGSRDRGTMALPRNRGVGTRCRRRRHRLSRQRSAAERTGAAFRRTARRERRPRGARARRRAEDRAGRLEGSARRGDAVDAAERSGARDRRHEERPDRLARIGRTDAARGAGARAHRPCRGERRRSRPCVRTGIPAVSRARRHPARGGVIVRKRARHPVPLANAKPRVARRGAVLSRRRRDEIVRGLPDRLVARAEAAGGVDPQQPRGRPPHEVAGLVLLRVRARTSQRRPGRASAGLAGGSKGHRDRRIAARRARRLRARSPERRGAGAEGRAGGRRHIRRAAARRGRSARRAGAARAGRHRVPHAQAPRGQGARAPQSLGRGREAHRSSACTTARSSSPSRPSNSSSRRSWP